MNFTTVCHVCSKPLTVSIPDHFAKIDMKFSHAAQSQRKKDGKPFEEAMDLMELLARKLVPTMNHTHCVERRDRKYLAEEKAAKLVARAEAWAGICPAIYQATDPSRIPDQAAYAEAMTWKYGPKGMVLHGPTGFGKTRIAYQVVRREFDASRMVFAFTHSEFASKVIKLMDGRHSLDKWVDVLCHADLLFIDDLGKSRFTDYADRGKHSEEVLFSIFETRTAINLPTIFTTNLAGHDLKAAMSPDRGAPFVRRLNEFSTYIGVSGSKRRTS